MIGKIKKFDEKLYNKYDQPARKIIQEKLKENIEDNPDIYGEDMIIKNENCKYKYLELQVCCNWISDKFPYQKPFVYARKKLFSDDTLFIIFNKNFTTGLLFDKKSLSAEARRVKKYSRYYVYDIPWHRILRINIEDLNIETINSY